MTKVWYMVITNYSSIQLTGCDANVLNDFNAS